MTQQHFSQQHFSTNTDPILKELSSINTDGYGIMRCGDVFTVHVSGTFLRYEVVGLAMRESESGSWYNTVSVKQTLRTRPFKDSEAKGTWCSRNNWLTPKGHAIQKAYRKAYGSHDMVMTEREVNQSLRYSGGLVELRRKQFAQQAGGE